MREEPLLRKCCGCLPLRLSLQIWAWFKVLADIISSLYLMIGLIMFFLTHDNDPVLKFSHEHFFMMVLVALIVDLCFIIVLIAGIYKKSYSSLRLFFYYGIYMVLAEATIMSIFVLWPLSKSPLRSWNSLAMYYIVFSVLGLIWIMIDICIIMTVKSEMTKIKNKEQYDFTKIPPFAIGKEETTVNGNIIKRDCTTKLVNEEEKYQKLLE